MNESLKESIKEDLYKICEKFDVPDKAREFLLNWFINCQKEMNSEYQTKMAEVRKEGYRISMKDAIHKELDKREKKE